MRRLAAMTLVLALAAAACGGDDGDPASTPVPNGEAVEPLDPAQSDEEAAEVDVAIPDVELTIPAPGQPTTVRTRVEATGVDAIEDDAPDPGVFLARSPQEAQLISRRVPPSAAEHLQAWNRYGRLALIVVSGGPQPDARNRLRVDSVAVLVGGEVIQAFGEIVRQGQGAQVLSVPWAVVSIDVGFTVAAERCVVAFKGASAVENRCR